MSERIPCCVPFCRRTFKAEADDGEELVCGKHFRLADAILRRRMTKVRRIWKRAVLKGDEAKGRRAWTLDNLLWKTIKKQIIERAAGL